MDELKLITPTIFNEEVLLADALSTTPLSMRLIVLVVGLGHDWDEYRTVDVQVFRRQKDE